MVNLTRIYTRTGDHGSTRLASNESIAKTDVRLAVYGTADEANSMIGFALSEVVDVRIAEVLTTIQNDLFDVGADLATGDGQGLHEYRVDQSWVERLEGWCDEFSIGLPALRSFLLPGGTPLASKLHLARTIVRRGEREGWKANEEVEVNPYVLKYLNRLSDLLFILARHANRLAGLSEPLWSPRTRTT